MEQVVAGLDIGTSSIKIVLYGERGVIYSARIDYSPRENNGNEIDPVRLLKNITYLIRKSKTENKNVNIRAIGISSLFPSFIALDKKGRPLTKVITWMDNRGDEIVLKFKTRKKEALLLQKRTGCIIHESHSLWKILWFKENKRNIFKKAAKFLSLPDYVMYQLTGKFVTSYAIASTTSLFNISTLGWDKNILKMVGISADQLPKCCSIYHGEQLLKKIRIKIDLGEDVLLVIGAGDGQLSNIGSGCLTDKKMCSTIGTSSALRIIGGDRAFNRSVWKYYLYDKRYIYGMATNAGFRTLIWFYQNIFRKNSNTLFANIKKIDIKRITDIIILPFMNGERGPGYNQKMLASLSGINSKNTDVDLFKAAIEGVLFNLYQCYEILVSKNNKPRSLIATGGYVYSEKMLQMQADIFNVKVVVPYIKEASAVGAAVLALVAIGEALSFSEIKAKYEKVYIPNKRKYKEYMIKYRKYRKLYDTIANFISRDHE